MEQRQESHAFPYRRRGAGYGARHIPDQGTITPKIEVAKAAVAPIVFPTDGIDRVCRRRASGRIAVAGSAVIAVNRKAQLLRRNLIAAGRRALKQLEGFVKGEFS